MFSGVAETRQTLAFHNTTDASINEPEHNQVATLLPGQEGPSKSVAVQAGDTIHLQVNARYETVPSQVQGLEGIATEVAGAVEKTAAGLESQGAGGSLNGIAASGALASGQEASVPKAYLNYLLYDEEYQLLDQGYVQVSEAAAVGKSNPEAKAEELSLDVAVAENGYLYTYLSYEGGGSSVSSPAASSTLAANNGLPANGPIANNSIPVYFDDFTIEQQSYIVAVHDLYPFGADFDQSPSRSVGLNGKYSYQGKELIADLGLNLYDFHARQYDPLLGRFVQVDPAAMAFAGMSPYVGMGNNPIIIVDPDGRWIHIVVGAVIGGAINLGIKLYQNKIDGFGDGLAAFGIGAAAGAIGAATGGAAFLAAGGGAAGTGGFLAGFAGGAVGSAFGSPIQSIGNNLYFGDPLMTTGEYALGILGGGLLGGATNGIIGAFNGKSFLRGNPLPGAGPATTPAPGIAQLEKPKALKLNTELPEPTLQNVPSNRAPNDHLSRNISLGDGLPNNNVALSVRENLDDFASAVNGSIWKTWGTTNFQDQFLTVINNPSNKIHFNLTLSNGSRMNVWQAVQQGSKGIQGGVTNWELFNIYSTPGALQRTTFYFQNQVVPNPF